MLSEKTIPSDRDGVNGLGPGPIGRCDERAVHVERQLPAIPRGRDVAVKRGSGRATGGRYVLHGDARDGSLPSQKIKDVAEGAPTILDGVVDAADRSRTGGAFGTEQGVREQGRTTNEREASHIGLLR